MFHAVIRSKLVGIPSFLIKTCVCVSAVHGVHADEPRRGVLLAYRWRREGNDDSATNGNATVMVSDFKLLNIIPKDLMSKMRSTVFQNTLIVYSWIKKYNVEAEAAFIAIIN